jgi:acid phosphatase type 7
MSRRALGAGVAALLAFAAPAAAQDPPVVAAAGDIACDPESTFFNDGVGDPARCRQQATSDLIVGQDLAAVLPLGDIQYEDAALWKFERSYGPSWGRLRDISRPVIGNHEYFREEQDGDSVPGGAGYFDYFNGAGEFGGPAGDRDKAYYSYDVGAWHVVALNSICSQIGGCGPGSPQERWLRADLEAHPSACTLAYWHHPMYTSAGAGWESMETIWQVLLEHGVDVSLHGHIHNYERLAPMNAMGAVDGAHGIRSFVVGSGGKNLQTVPALHPATEALNVDTFGVLFMTLRPDGYDWRFSPVAGSAFSDAGSAACHGPPPPRAPAATTGPVSQVRPGGVTVGAAVEAGGQPTTYRFEYGTSAAYGLSTPDTPLPQEGFARQPVSAQISGLTDGELYHYRVVATNPSGVFAGPDRVLRAGQTSRYADLVANTPGLLAHWRLGETSGGTAFEERGAYRALYSGSYTLRRRGAIADEANRAAGFALPAGSLRAYGPALAQAGSVEGWFRWSDGTTLMRDDTAQGGWHIARATGGRLSFRVGGVRFLTERAIGSVRDGAWHHIVLSKVGDFVTLHIDGRRVFAGTGAPNTPTVMPWHVMRDGPFPEHSLGAADELAFYDRALPAATIRRHYRAGVASQAPVTRVAGPPRYTNRRSPTLAISSSKRASTLRCALERIGGDVATVRQCASENLLRGLPDGAYRFTAYAVTRRGYPDPTPASRTFTVDTVTPSAIAEMPERSVRDLVRSGVPVRVTCTETCRLRARLVLSGTSARRAKLTRGRPVEIGRAYGTVRANAAGTVRVRLTSLARRHLRRLDAARISLRLSAADRAGNTRGVRSAVPIAG